MTVNLHYYVLTGKIPVRSTLAGWTVWKLRKEDFVALDDINGVTVSTIFVGVDDRPFKDLGEPLLYSTEILGGVYEGWLRKSSTWHEAEAEHDRACDVVAGLGN